MPHCNSSFGQRSFSYCAPKIWNDIPLSVRQSLSLDSFKRNLKTYYFANNWLPGDCLQCFWFDILDILCFTDCYEWMKYCAGGLTSMTLGMYILLVLGKKLLGSRISDLAPAPRGGSPNLPRSISAIGYTALCSCRYEASQQHSYAVFYVVKIPTKNLMLGNSQHQIRENRPIGRADPIQVGWLFYYLHASN